MINYHDAITFGQKSDSFRKRDSFLLHDKGKDIAPLSAAKAVKHLLVLAYGKRWGLFRVKGAKPEEVPARFFQHDRIGNDFQNISAVFYLGYFFCRDGVRQEQASKVFRKRQPFTTKNQITVSHQRGLIISTATNFVFMANIATDLRTFGNGDLATILGGKCSVCSSL